MGKIGKIVLGLIGASVAGVGYYIFIVPGPGEWSKEDMEDRLGSFTLANAAETPLYTQIELGDELEDDLEILGVDFTGWSGSLVTEKGDNCAVLAVQNEEIRLSFIQVICDWGTNEFIDVNDIEGCGNKVLVDMMKAFGDTPSISNINSMQDMDKLEKQQKEYLRKVESAVQAASNEGYSGACATMTTEARKKVQDMKKAQKESEGKF